MGPLLFLDLNHHPIFNFGFYFARYSFPVFAAGAAMFVIRFARHVDHVQQNARFRLASGFDEPRLTRIIETQAIGAGIATPRVGIIETDARNAFACGMSEYSAVIVVTRGLLQALNDDELEAVAAHAPLRGFGILHADHTCGTVHRSIGVVFKSAKGEGSL